MSQPSLDVTRVLIVVGGFLFATIVAVFSIALLQGYFNLAGISAYIFGSTVALILLSLLLLIYSKIGIIQFYVNDDPGIEGEMVVLEGSQNHNSFSLDLDFKYLYFSERHERDVRKFFHQKPSLGRSFFDVIPTVFAKGLEESFQEGISGKHLTLRRQFGSDYFELVLNPMYDNSSNVSGLTCYFENITSKINMERQLEAYHEDLEKAIDARAGEIQEQRDFFQKIIDSVANLIFVRDGHGKYVLVNKSAADSFPENLGSVIGKSTLDTHGNESEAKRFLQEDREILLTGKKIVSESIHEGPDGVEKFLYLTKSPLEVKGKKFVLGVHTDITELKKQEQALLESNEELKKTLEKLKKAQESLIESEKLASLGQLTAGLAHEINNPINYVSGNVSPLLEGFKEVDLILEKVLELKSELRGTENGAELLELMDEYEIEELVTEIRSLLEGIADGTSRVKELMHSLKNLSRQNENTLVKININKIIISTLALIKPSLPDTIKVLSELGELPAILGSPGEISQVLLNIIDNAIAAMGSKGELFIKSELGSEEVLIEISDTGRGISPENLKRIFEPFYTTKEVGDGTGLGLAISHQIINKHQGRILVESQLYHGSTFKIFLPLSAG